MSGLVSKFRSVLEERRSTPHFVRTATQFFGEVKSVARGSGHQGKVLVETGWWMYPNYIGVLYALSELGYRESGLGVGYEIPPQLGTGGAQGRTTKFGNPGVRRRLANFLTRRRDLWRALGITSFCSLELSHAQTQEAAGILSRWVKAIRSLRDIESLTEGGVFLGDLVYDDYLTVKLTTEIDWTSADFRQHLSDFARMFVYFRDLLASGEYSGVIVSQSVYRNAIPSRIAINQGIATYLIDHEVAYRLSAERPIRDLESRDFHARFRAYSEEDRLAFLKLAEGTLERRWSGISMVGLEYMEKTAFGPPKAGRILAVSNRPKVLIAPHDFFDSPHCYGSHAFPDFTQWLNFLGRLAAETDYDWYLKTHTNLPAYSQTIIDEYCKNHPWVTLLPSDTSHQQLVAEGIDVVLTLYGTIAAEYASVGKLAISASTSTPHAAYGFCLNANTEQELETWLRNLPTLTAQWSVDLQQVHEYFFMAHLERERSWLFADLAKLENGMVGPVHQPGVYRVWAESWTEADHRVALTAIRDFFRSSDYMLVRRRSLSDRTVQ